MSSAYPFAGPAHAPYADAAANALYNLLFCDRPQDHLPRYGSAPTPWQTALLSTPPNLRFAAQLAADRRAEARLRLLACHVLRSHAAPVPGRELLGVVVEVPLDDGLDTLAAYVDGSVRYIRQTGRIEIVEAVQATLPIVKRLMETSAAVVSRIGPSEEARPPAPPLGHIRLSFLVTDGLYFGQGGLPVMQRDRMAGPVIAHAAELLQTVIGLARRLAA